MSSIQPPRIRSHNRGLSASVLLMCCAAATVSGMAWTVLTEPILSATLWPGDIHRAVVRLMGGDVVDNAAGPITNLSWPAVALRVAALAVLAVLAVAVSAWRQARSDRSDRSSMATVSLHLARVGIMAGIWLVLWFSVTTLVNPGLLNFFTTITPLCTALVVALFVDGVFRAAETTDEPEALRAEPRVTAQRRSCTSGVVLILAAMAWIATSFWMNERLYAGLLVPHGDSAMYEEHLWNTWHGKGFRSYLDQGLFLGEHIQVIHLLLLPLHMLWPSYLMMELAAGLSLAACSLPIYRMTLRHSGDSRAAMWLALAWLLYVPMHFLDIAIDIKTLRPSCYGLPFLFFAIDLAEQRRLKLASLCFLIALTTQEDFALVIGSIGVVFFVMSKREPAPSRDTARGIWGIGVAALAMTWLLLAVLVVIPLFRAGDSVHYARYFGDLGKSPGDLLRTALQQPAKLLRVLVSWRTLFYVLVLSVPLGFSPLRRPLVLSAGVLTFTMLSLIQLGNAADSTAENDAASVMLMELPPVPYHHFHAPLLPVIFWAAARAMQPQPRRTTTSLPAGRRSIWRSLLVDHTCLARDRARFACLCALGTAFFGSMMPVGATFWSAESSWGWRTLYVPGPRATEFPNVLALLPRDARVASTDFVHTRLTHFERSYDYSNYPRAVNNYQPGVPPDTDFIVIDTAHPYSAVRSLADVRELQVESDRWDVLPDETGGLFIVLKRRSESINP